MKQQHPEDSAVFPKAFTWIILLVVFLPVQFEAQWLLPRAVIASGNVTGSGNNYAIKGTIGQSIIGPAKSQSHAGFFGFWYNINNVTVQVRRIDGSVLDRFVISEVYPNPATGSVTCVFTVPARGSIRLSLYDMLGHEVQILESHEREGGRYELNVSLRGLPVGYYLLRVDWNNTSRGIPLTVLR